MLECHFGGGRYKEVEALVHMEIPSLRKFDFIPVDDPSYMSGQVLHGNLP